MALVSLSRRQLLCICFLAALTTVCAEAVADLTLDDLSPEQIYQGVQVRHQALNSVIVVFLTI